MDAWMTWYILCCLRLRVFALELFNHLQNQHCPWGTVLFFFFTCSSFTGFPLQGIFRYCHIGVLVMPLNHFHSFIVCACLFEESPFSHRKVRDDPINTSRNIVEVKAAPGRASTVLYQWWLRYFYNSYNVELITTTYIMNL